MSTLSDAPRGTAWEHGAHDGRSAAYRPEVDGLRALAVTAVIINHFNPSILPSGYLGVDIFFVISGFVITSSLADHQSASLRELFLAFYARRIKRLVPALVLFVGITAIGICLFNPEPKETLRLGRAALMGISNIVLFRAATDYFAPSTELDPFTHTWSLGVEEQFYVLYPVLIWLSGFGRRGRRGDERLGRLVFWLSAASLCVFAYLYSHNQPAAYFLMPTRLWELGAGCLLFLHLRRDNSPLGHLTSLPPLPLICALAAVLFAPQEAAVAATAAAVFLTVALMACARAGTCGHAVLTHRRVVYVGLISYSLYLWHWGVLCMSRWTVGIHLWLAPLQVALMLALAIVSYKYVEVPLRHANWSSLRWRTISFGIMASLAAAMAVGALARSSSTQRALYAGASSDLEKQYPVDRPVKGRKQACNIFDERDLPAIASGSCGFRAGLHRPTIFLLGDSHVAQFAAAMDSYAQQNSYNVTTIWGNTCLFPAAVVRNRERDCYNLQQDVEDKVRAEVKSGDVVILGNALYAAFSGHWVRAEAFQDGDGGPLSITEASVRYAKSLQRFADDVVAKGARVVVLVDGVQFPRLGSGNQRCDEQWFRPWPHEDCFVDRSMYLQQRDAAIGWILGWADGVNTFAWDPVDDTTCMTNRCRATHYADSNHFKAYYAAYLLTQFRNRFPNAL